MTNKNVVSFDVFDTAIVRDVYLPTDIFKLVEEQVGNDFFNKRLEAENLARAEVENYSIADIYKHLPEFDMNVEIDIELKHCKNNFSLIHYKFLASACIFISDMYLPSSVIKQMLEKCGYKNPEVYVSCELNAHKSDGGLFKAVEKLTGKKIKMHIGDNYVADILGAKLAGIKETRFIPALHKTNFNLPKVKNPMFKKWLAEIQESNMSAIHKLAFYYMPLMFEFTKWILSQQESGQKIFFLSRDMYMPYKIATEYFDAKDVYYLHVSRKSIANFCLECEDEKVREKIQKCFEGQKFSNEKEVLKYLKRFKINDGDIIADIGYFGTIQAGIDKALNIKTKGLYIQTSPETAKNIDTKMFLSRIAICFCLLVEFAFCSPEDNVEGYKNGEVIWSKDNYERKRIAQKILDVCCYCDFEKIEQMNISVSDLEQVLIHNQYYPSDELIKIYNNKFYTNREQCESIINFDIEGIKQGNLLELYEKSYCQHLFKKLLEKNVELHDLIRLIK